jgi:4a-hydroxytetrahydrobiopterin dehydratase
MSWTEIDNTLEKEWLFGSFSEAFAFICRVALLAEKHNHHPEIQNTYNRVKLRLSTHDAGNTITEKDRRLATAIDALKIA